MVVKGVLFGKLDDDIALRYAKLLQQLGGKPVLVLRRTQQRGGNVKKQLPFKRFGCVTLQRPPSAGQLKFVKHMVDNGGVKQMTGLIQPAVRRPPNQRLLTDTLPGTEINDRLKKRVKLLIPDDLGE